MTTYTFPITFNATATIESDPKETRRCPECGDDGHLYARSDLRWDVKTGQWESSGIESSVECTECDWSGFEEDALPRHVILHGEEGRKVGEAFTEAEARALFSTVHNVDSYDCFDGPLVAGYASDGKGCFIVDGEA